MLASALRPASRWPSSTDSRWFFLSLSLFLCSRLKVTASRQLGGGLFAILAARVLCTLAWRPCCLSSLVQPICKKTLPLPSVTSQSSACQPLRNIARRALPRGSMRTKEEEVGSGVGGMKNGGMGEWKIKKKMRAAGMGRGAKKKKREKKTENNLKWWEWGNATVAATQIERPLPLIWGVFITWLEPTPSYRFPFSSSPFGCRSMRKAISFFKLLHFSRTNCTFETCRSEDIHHGGCNPLPLILPILLLLLLGQERLQEAERPWLITFSLCI